MQKLILLLLFAISAFATRIQDNDVRDSSGRKITSGTISVCPPSSFSSGSYWISKDCVQVSITSGKLSVTLQPGTYRAHWVTPAIEDQTWIVADSGTPLRVQDVVSTRSGYFCVNFVGGALVGDAPTGACGTITSLFDSASGLFDSASGLFDAH
jgi:hypothetical protein